MLGLAEAVLDFNLEVMTPYQSTPVHELGVWVNVGNQTTFGGEQYTVVDQYGLNNIQYSVGY